MKTELEKAMKHIRKQLRKTTDESQKSALREELKKLKYLQHPTKKAS
jgi:hypothetical protein